jgi:hypothetical protein
VRVTAKLPFPATRIVKALTRDETRGGISSGKVLVWLEHYAIDESADGAYLSAAEIAARVGMSAATVEEYRRELLAIGLLEKFPTRRGAKSGWRCTLPKECIPESAKPRIAELHLLGGRLAGFIARARQGRTGPGSDLRPANPDQPPTQARVGNEPQPRPATSPGINPNPVLPLPARMTEGEGQPGPGGILTAVGEVGENPLTAVRDVSLERKELENGNGASHDGDGKESVREILERIEQRVTVPQAETLEERRAKWRAYQRGAA